MKILIQSILFIIIVGLFAITSDRLSKIEQKESMDGTTSEVQMSDQDFLTQMIEHHQGAIAMAQEAETKSSRQEIRDFAGSIISAQTSEIDQMYAWRKQWFGESEHISMRMGADMPSMAVDLGSADADFDKRFLQAMIAHHEGAIKIWQSMGIILGYGLAHYADFYEMRHVLILGRCTSGRGGELLLEGVRSVFEAEFPDLLKRFTVHLPDEKMRRVGQSVAAASLPALN